MDFATVVRGMLRGALGVSVAACAAGVIATLLGWTEPARTLLIAALLLLVLLPAVNVAAAVVVELRRGAWRFAAAALAVLVVLAYEMAAALSGAID